MLFRRHSQQLSHNLLSHKRSWKENICIINCFAYVNNKSINFAFKVAGRTSAWTGTGCAEHWRHQSQRSLENIIKTRAIFKRYTELRCSRKKHITGLSIITESTHTSSLWSTEGTFLFCCFYWCFCLLSKFNRATLHSQDVYYNITLLLSKIWILFSWFYWHECVLLEVVPQTSRDRIWQWDKSVYHMEMTDRRIVHQLMPAF